MAGLAVGNLNTSPVGHAVLRPFIYTTEKSLDVQVSAPPETTCLEIQISGFHAPGYEVLNISLSK